MAVVNAAFSDLVLSQGVVSDPIALGENHIVMVRLLEHFPEAQLPLEDVRQQVVEAVKQQRAMDAASARAEELLANLTGGSTIDELAESSGLELVQAEAAKRTDPAIAADLRSKVFLMQTPGDGVPVTAVLELDNGYAVVELDSVKPGELSEDDAQRKAAYQRRIATATGNTEIFGFVKMLRAQSDIKVFEDRF
jgi:peptidyl-prolyl cis-trans isomerase D